MSGTSKKILVSAIRRHSGLGRSGTWQQYPNSGHRSAHLLFSADLNAACPNSVIEALACGLPVLAFATGSLPEIISGDSGLVVPYGSNYWNLENPDIAGLAKGAVEILTHQEKYRAPARSRAEEAFGLSRMVEQYISALFD
jgi:glycosyltransferase involved in cell wall biosynthesis